MSDKYSKMKKAITRERRHAFGKNNQTPRLKGGSAKRKLPNFLANLEKLGHTESEGAAFLKQFAHDALL